ncbi:MAG: signal peptidase II [Patescibacteria group bacterium]
MKKLAPLIKLSAIFLFLVLVDQLTKFVFPITHINSGISFGLASGLEPWLLVILLVGVWFAIEFISKTQFFLKRLMSIFFLAGAVSNLFDRLFLGGVRDWWQWPIFNFSNNLADVWITIGLLGIIYFEIWNKK